MAGIRESRGACKILVRGPQGKRQLGGSNYRGKDNISMKFTNGVGEMHWRDLAQNRDK